MEQFKFPDKFFWGAAMSAYQHEGGIFNCDWFLWEIDKKLEAAGEACRHYEMFESDFDLAKNLNLNAVRISLEWSRFYPKYGFFSGEAPDHYGAVVKAMRARGLEPFITLHHFTNPLWFAERGGWINHKNIDYFVEYVRTAAQALKGDVKYWLIFNEPMVFLFNAFVSGRWPPGRKSISLAYKALENVLKAYCLAYEEIKSVYKGGETIPLVSFTQHLRGFEPCSPHNKIEATIASWRDHKFNGALIETLAKKGYLDFLGINYYTKEYVAARGFLGRECLERHHKERKNFLGWNVAPDKFYEILMRFKDYKIPLIVTENGTAEKEDNLYEEFMLAHLKAMARAIADGVQVRGYFWWSLLDNFEWADGFSPRFGLYEVNYHTFERKLRPYALTYGKIAEANSIAL